jgi:hypothetical protein
VNVAAISAKVAEACRLALLTLVGIVVSVLVLLVMPVLRPDLDPLRYAFSYYTVGPWGFVQSVGFAVMGVSSLLLAATIWLTRIAGFWGIVCVALLVVAGLGALGLFAYPMSAAGPATFIGDAHQTMGTIGGVAQLAAALAFTLAVANDVWWRRLYRPALVGFLIAGIAALLTQIAIWRPDLGIPIGLTSRLVVIPLLLLWGLVAWRLRQRCARIATRSAAAR